MIIVVWTLDFGVGGQRKKGRLKRTWKKQIEEESIKVGLSREDALCRSWCIVGVNLIATGLKCIWPFSIVGDTTDFKYCFLYLNIRNYNEMLQNIAFA